VIVIDSSAFVKFILREEGWEELVDYLKPDMDPCTLDYLLIESTNAVWKYCRLHGVIAAGQALRLFEYMMKLFGDGVIHLEEAGKYLGEGLKTALERGLSVYDALFIVQARARGATLVTSDSLQEKVAKELGVKTIFIP